MYITLNENLNPQAEDGSVKNTNKRGKGSWNPENEDQQTCEKIRKRRSHHRNKKKEINVDEDSQETIRKMTKISASDLGFN